MGIEFQGVCKRFGETRALQDVMLTIEENKIYGLLGNNGAGKSTLLNVLTGRVPMDGGEVTVDGYPVGSDEAQSRMFLVGEKNLYPEDMKVRRAFDTAALFYPAFDREMAETLAQEFGLATRKKITSLSTGYGSIFRLILGLCVNTPYVLFDEPVLGLDAQHRDIFYRRLLQKYADAPCTIVLSTHLIAEVAEIIEHTVIIRDGRILQDAPTECLTAGAYTVSGPAGAVEQYLAGRDVMSRSVLGGLVTACVRGTAAEPLPAGLERSGVKLQDYFISLMQEEDRR